MKQLLIHVLIVSVFLTASISTFTSWSLAADLPPTTEEIETDDLESEETSEMTTPEITPEDIGIEEDGTTPMLLTNQDGEPLSDQYQVVSDGVNEKFRIAEDATNVSITEHSVCYNTAALESAGIPVAGAPDIQWTLTDASGKTVNAGNGSTSYSGVLKTPGHYNLGNSGMTPVDSSVVTWGGGGVNSGTDVELEVTDITAPAMKVVVTPEDYHEHNTLIIEEDPENLDAYPINNKTAQVSLQGRNWSQAGAADGAAPPADIKFTTYFGMVAPEDADFVEDSKKNPDIKAKNEYTMNSALDSSLGEGFYVPVSVRTNFDVSIKDDNDPRNVYREKEAKTWKLSIEHNGKKEVFKEPPSYIFRIPNVPATSDSPRYTLTTEVIDGSGNAIMCNIPINVIPKRMNVRDLENRSRKQ